MRKIVLFLFLSSMMLKAQENPLDIFKPLENYIWCAEGKWGDGSKFKQEINFEFSLNNKIVKVKSLGFTNKEQTEYGLRNQGVRQYDQASKKIKFWEFDVFGGLTEGVVEVEGNNLVYKYDYGGTFVTEMWIYKNETSYDFVVGVYEEGKWKQKFLETEFICKAK